jgi:branched-chain amino acid transport system ATP-binding protein
LGSPDLCSLDVQGISASYGARQVLTDFTLRLRPGELVSVLGHNGAGKTTALRVISGLKAPTGGSVFLDGVRLGRKAAHTRARMGLAMVPEGVAGLFPTLTVRQNLEAVVPFTERRETSRLEQMEHDLNAICGDVLSGKMNQVAGSMSGGQRQMLAIAMALTRHPKVLLLDEPSTGLAPLMVERILRVVQQSVQAGRTSVVLVEQNLANALRVSSRAIVVQSGRVVAEFERDDFPDPTALWHYF